LLSYDLALLGGGLIGLASALVLLTHGRIAGISGLFAGIFLPKSDARSFRLWFIAGLVVAGLGLSLVFPLAVTSPPPRLSVVAMAGLLVGYGTRLGNGCTSGHGVCGIGRLWGRSIAATAVFMATGMLTVYVARHVIGVVR
jgi:uncharacterized membrane protein YedE/YeeE